MKLKEIADAIDGILREWEANPRINKNTKPDRSGTSDYYKAGAYVAGRFVAVCYITYQGSSNLSKREAEHYLSLIRKGYIGRHFEAFREHPIPDV